MYLVTLQYTIAKKNLGGCKANKRRYNNNSTEQSRSTGNENLRKATTEEKTTKCQQTLQWRMVEKLREES